MGRELFTNAVPSTVDGTINSVVTSVDVIDASTWPTAAFRVVCETEVMWCIARTGNTLSVIRGYEGSTAAGHADTTKINHSVTAGTFVDGFYNNCLRDVAIMPDADSVSADDDHFDDESIDGAWVNTGDPGSVLHTLTERNHRFSVMHTGGGSGQRMVSMVKAKSPSAGDWVQCGFHMATAYQYHMCGLVMANGNTYNAGRQVTFMAAPVELYFFLREFTGYNIWNTGTNNAFGTAARYTHAPCHMRLEWVSSNTYKCYMSLDGTTWVLLNGSGTSCGTVGSITHMGFTWSTWGGPDMNACFLYCRFSF